jgi:hypothetical protein
MRAGDQSASQDQGEIEEKLQADEANADRSRATPPEPPNTEEKQDPEHWLVTMQNRERGTTVDSEDQQRGTQ